LVFYIHFQVFQGKLSLRERNNINQLGGGEAVIYVPIFPELEVDR
jgi:hypothetical protein